METHLAHSFEFFFENLLLGFWDPQDAKPFDPTSFRVAAGKERLEYDAYENPKDQKFMVNEILYDEDYNHATSNFASDIALIVLNGTIEFRSHIAPICIPYGLNYDETIVPAGWIGRVAGFGKTGESFIRCD